jgi:hypothetical protein
MIAYQLEMSPDSVPGQWVITALFGNDIQWEVGRYRDKRQAEDRIQRMEEVSKAASLTG